MKVFPIGARLSRTLLLLAALLPIFLSAAATDFQRVVGIVSDADTGEPLIGVTVMKEGTTSGTVTDLDGRYEIDAEPSDNLIFSYTGMATQIIPVKGQTTINITLAADAELLDEVVVVGYGKQKKSHLTGAVSGVKNEKLDQIPISRVDDALVGQVAGLNIQSTNPAAGEAPSIRVRGQGSISFDSNPLIVVDGIVVGTDADYLASMDMNNVESIEVLKDAASSAIYGSRGANGIIMITTKEGREGPTQFSYDAFVGYKDVPTNDVLTSPSAWADYTRANNNGELPDKLQYIERLGTYTNWEEVMFNGGMINSHSLSARGGTANTKFRTSVSYLKDEGVLLTDSYSKLNFSLNLDTKVSDRIDFGVRLNPSYTKQREFPIGVHDAIRQQPWLPLYLDEDNIQYVNRFRENGRWADAQIGDYAMERMFDDYDLDAGRPSEGSGTDISGTSNASALAKVLERRRQRTQTKVFANTYLNFHFNDDLYFKQSIGGDVRFTERTRWAGVMASRNGASDTESTLSNATQYHIISESTLNWDKDFGQHSINAVGGFAYERWDRDYSSIEAAGFDFDFIETIPAANLVGGSSSSAQEVLISYLSRINYSFADRYLLSISARTDGSSKFGPQNKFGFFPAASVGWRVSQENFLSSNRFIDELKLRFSYGISGSNSGIGEYDYIGLIEPVGAVLGGGVTGFNPTNISNSELRWEKLRELNPGIDVSILDGRFSGSFDFYIRRSEDLLLGLPIPSVTGFSTALVNKGEVENKGFELELTSNNYSTGNFSWTTGVILSRNKNTLIDFAGASGLISIVDDKRPAEWIAQEGNPISSFYGYVVEKEIELGFLKNPFFPINGQSQDIYVKDLNGDGLIDTDDRTILGSPYPDLIWSVNNTFRLGNFDASFMFQGSHGAEVRNISSQYINNEFSSNQDYTSEFPDAGQVVERIFTTDDIQDASYVALRNLNIGFTLPSGILDRVGIRKLRVYAGAQNLLYIMSDDYVGYNPEGIDQGLDSPLTYGYQRGPAPIYRTVSAGLNLSF
ncbi:TonB-linked SusC/RagA family outer membrane protein [Lewinella aquimaris]|uniref:TonB-linked SusC/RagA family outer membrane protein n=1 Tax=Neolewinella aquimaris TaxID=1835722 RepID=A0A840E3A2_9BACT|nr:TonB-dependent receptor [Neolewinella aquimaris]MBB4079570.1 TonB-linked SusC/RagA family outer membrane protein [Neolewinella aquimaris]